MLGDAARTLMARRRFSRLGFVRIADYARERLGVSGRTLQVAAWLAARLEALPLVGAAFDHSEISWSQARAICRVASLDDQLPWLSRARALSAEKLEALSRRVGRGDDPEDSDEDEIDGEPAVRLRLPCPARIRALWRHAVAVASRVAGEPLPIWRAAELVAAEAFAGRPTGASFGDRALAAAMRLANRTRRLATRIASPASAPDMAGAGSSLEDDSSSAVRAPRPHLTEPSGNASSTDAFALDARLVDAIATLRTTEPRIGRLLRVLVDHRLYRSFGYRKLDAYVRERLGISTRKAWALVTIERRVRAIPALADEYEGGRLSWVRMLTLLPIVHRDNAEAWVARARSVTVRRLVDEVSWVLETRDAPLGPPPAESELASPVGAAGAAGGDDVDVAEAAATGAGNVDVAEAGAAGAGYVDVAHPAAEAADTAAGSEFPKTSIASTAARESQKSSPALRVQIGAHAPPFSSAAGSECRQTSLAGACGALRPVEIAGTELAFTAPTTVVALFRDTMDAFATSGEPRWTALERMVRHVVAFWESAPRHRDPVFDGDGWRCTVPGCSSRRNLHDHHVLFRSRGGSNARDNRTTICAAHHLHGIHAGTIRARGAAPRALHWELGIRGDAPPLLRYVGDTIV